MKLKDRVAIVTGAGSGIGQASAMLFAAEGAKVAVVDLKPDAARATAEQIEKAGGQALALAADVSRSDDNRDAVAQTVARWGRLDVFYANAGVPQWPTPVEDMDESTFDRIMAVNVKGVFLGAKFAAPVMKKQKSGVILITGSTAAFKPRPGGQCYAASKGAVHRDGAEPGRRARVVRHPRGGHRAGGHGDAHALHLHGQEGDRRRRHGALHGHRAPGAPQSPRGPRQGGPASRLGRRGDDHGESLHRRRRPLRVNVVPLAADSLGVRSMATYVECGQTRILIDPGAALAPNRFGLSPADEEWEALKRANDRISAYATRAGMIFLSHYHEDHFRHDPGLYEGRTVWAKDARRMINPRQAQRAGELWKSIGGACRLDSAEGESWRRRTRDCAPRRLSRMVWRARAWAMSSPSP